MLLSSLRLAAVAFVFTALSGSPPSVAASSTADIPAWLQKHVGTGEGQIAPVVLERARALYQQKLRQGEVRNPCYLAKDATRPSTAPDGAPGPHPPGSRPSCR